MKIALLGYGKMGKAIETEALARHHTVVLKVDRGGSLQDIKTADVAIDFSTPSSAYKNICECLENRVPVVCGTTGWLEQYDKAVELSKQCNGAFLYASNFSLGVNIFFEINRYLASIIGPTKQYQPSIEEVHHTEKLDAPSGTAITLANAILPYSGKTGWRLQNPTKPEADDSQLYITAKRLENVPGTHKIAYESPVDTITIEHTAHSRKGFALGAVVAAEWIIGKHGVFSMRDVLDLNLKNKK